MLGTAILAKKMVIGDLSEHGQIGYAETQKTVLLPQTTIETVFVEAEGLNIFQADPALVSVEANARVTVLWDGVEYACTASDKVAFNEVVSFVLIGNQGMAGLGDDTGEPFLIWCGEQTDLSSVRLYTVITSVTDGEHALSITKETETIHLIDPKYLPGVCLPLVELSTVITEEGVTLTDAEKAQVSEVATGLPFVVKAKVHHADGSDFPINAVLNCADFYDYKVYSVAFDGFGITYKIGLLGIGEEWTANANITVS